MLLFGLLISCSLLAIIQARVFEIYTQDHLHDLIQDTPVGNRPGIVIAFYNDTAKCQNNLKSLSFDDHNLPSIAHIILAKYEMSTSRSRVWHDYESHLDLAANLGIDSYFSQNPDKLGCPLLVYLPVAYSNFVGEWYRNQPPVNDTSLGLIHFYDKQEQNKHKKNWKSWLWSKLQTSIKIVSLEPFDFEVTIIPNAGRMVEYPLKCDKGSGNDCESADQVVKIKTYESTIELTDVFIGDSIFVSTNPSYPHVEAEQYSRPSSMKASKQESLKPTSDVPNPVYDVFGKDYWHDGFQRNLVNRYKLHRLDDGRYGFEISLKRFEDIQNDVSLIKRRHSTTCMTHTRNMIIPKILPHHNNPGFFKRKMPPGLHERLLRFYRHWHFKRETEGWDNVGTQLNFIDVRSYMVSLDHNFDERNSIANDVIKPILSEWAGGQELEFTAFYGLREYEGGAVLRNHVDRVDTHVFSAILQIAQTDINEDWVLEVVGFDGKYYNVTLKPGEMALYEGHALMHGRPKAFNGTLFTNAFVHFKPKDWSWSTSQVWRTQDAKDTLSLLHVRLQDLYR